MICLQRIISQQNRVHKAKLIFLFLLSFFIVNSMMSAEAADLEWTPGKTMFTYSYDSDKLYFGTVRSGLSTWSDILDVRFRYVPNSSRADIFIRVRQNSQNEPLTYNLYGSGGEGDSNVPDQSYITQCLMTLDETWVQSSDRETLVSTLAHGWGHCLGLIDDSNDPTSVMYSEDSGITTPNAEDMSRIHALHPHAPLIDTVQTNQTNATQWHTVTFKYSFPEPPIVVMSPVSYKGGHQTTTRVRNVTETGFEFQLDEWDYLDGAHVTETLYYMAVPAGVSTVSGNKITAGSTTLDHQWSTIPFSNAYDKTPVVFAQQVSSNDTNATSVRTRNVSRTQFQLRLQEEEGTENPTHAEETVHYIVFEQKPGRIGNRFFTVNLTANEVTHQWHKLVYQPISPGEFPVGNPEGVYYFFADGQTSDGGDNATLRYQQVGNGNDFQVKLEEERSRDTELWHTTESVGWLIWGYSSFTAQGD